MVPICSSASVRPISIPSPRWVQDHWSMIKCQIKGWNQQNTKLSKSNTITPPRCLLGPNSDCPSPGKIQSSVVPVCTMGGLLSSHPIYWYGGAHNGGPWLSSAINPMALNNLRIISALTIGGGAHDQESCTASQDYNNAWFQRGSV